MRLKAIVAATVGAAALSIASPAFAGGTEGGGTAPDCSNRNYGSISIGQGTVQCVNVDVNPLVKATPLILI